jgi:restriction system protein
MAGRSRGGSSDAERFRRQLEREAAAGRRAREAALKAEEKAAKARYVDGRKLEAETKTAELATRVDDLSAILRRGITRSSVIDLAAFRRVDRLPPLDLGGLATPAPRPSWGSFAPRSPSALGGLFGGQERHRRAVQAAEAAFAAAQRDWEAREVERQRQVAGARADHARREQAHAARQRAHNEALDREAAGLRDRERDAVERYLGRVLRALPLPKDFPRDAEVYFDAQAEQVGIKLRLPAQDVIPTVRQYQYVAGRDEEKATARPVRETGELYRSVISQVALLAIRDVFMADPHLESVAFNGRVPAINPATGRDEDRYLISLDVARAEFEALVLDRVTPDECVRALHAIVSKHPYELEGVEPIVDFDLKKYRLAKSIDVVATLDSRPDLLQMDPDHFEHLTRQVFEALGLEGWNTEHSYDDGVDAVMMNKTVAVGGLTIVQSKRYKNAIGVSHIRELAGAIEEKRATKGILVTTSWFTPQSERKAQENGRMELIDGQHLVWLIKQKLGKDVLVGIPKRPRRYSLPS